MNDLWELLSHNVRSLLDTHPLVIISAVLFFEELGVPSPIPGDVLMMLAGVGAAQGKYPLWLILLVQEVATLAGTLGLFLLSRRFGRSLVTRYGWILHLGPEQLARAEGAIQRFGVRAVLIGRLLPGLRIATPVAAGVLGMSLGAFLPGVAAGAFLYLLVFTLLGYFLGPSALALFEHVALPTGALFSLAAALAIFALLRRIKHELPAFTRGGRGAATAARVDGLIAGLITLLFTNGLVGVSRFVLGLFGYDAPLFVAEVGTGLRLLLDWPVFLLAGSLFGAFDEQLGAERLPPFARLVVTAGLPLALTLLIAVPLAEGNVIHLASGDGLPLVLIEALRWITFGVALNELLPLDAKIHQLAPAAPAAD